MVKDLAVGLEPPTLKATVCNCLTRLLANRLIIFTGQEFASKLVALTGIYGLNIAI